ncbi:glycine-rich domain-containing protein [Mucilaginibacter gilvus]|uniref:glycine-rich domain-containing protein n=1 Tax=Mucilaginibacter gilvus TaxID=2305909 RepID=UPI001ABAE8EF|nr:hypothetical protein [Mucilaginibacter gilvus]
MMKEEITLWQKIEAFRLDDPDAGFQFSARLARENGWSLEYSHRVIAEYKKFIFMCCISNTGVTPSDPVDQAWHLHLTFTRSYWVDLCRDTIGKQIHHNPTKGGVKEADKFDGFYNTSQKLYRDKFGIAPPVDIWHDNDERFSDINFRRVNLSRNWVIKKPRLSVALLTLLMLVVACTVFIQADGDYWASLIAVGAVILVAIDVRRWKSNPNRGKNNNDNSGSGCSTAGCGGDMDSSHHGGHDGGHSGDGVHSGCGSGCSGCSSSGCSGCGGGGD